MLSGVSSSNSAM